MSDARGDDLQQLRATCERLAARLDRVESELQLTRLANDYAFAADSRDLEGLVAMFVDDVDCGRFGVGRDALRASYEIVHRRFYRTVHQVVGHTFRFGDDDHATGRVMMRAEHEVGDRWVVGMLCMFDTYARRDGSWYFVRRKPESWYSTEYDDRPRGPDWTPSGWEGRTPRLPQLNPTWATFWDGDEERVEQLTRYP